MPGWGGSAGGTRPQQGGAPGQASARLRAGMHSDAFSANENGGQCWYRAQRARWEAREAPRSQGGMGPLENCGENGGSSPAWPSWGQAGSRTRLAEHTLSWLAGKGSQKEKFFWGSQKKKRKRPSAFMFS